MGKSSGVGIAILGLLIGIGGLGLAAYSYITFNGQIANLNTQMEERSVQATWYSENLDDWSPSTVDTNDTIPDLSINFQINEGESVYFLFIARAIIYSSSTHTYMRFTFSIDGTILDKPYTIAGGYNIDETYTYIPVALQYSTDTLAEGNHTVSVIALKMYSLNFIRQSSILVQTYIS